ncbi:DUF5895 domain-containing protein [Microcoleus sp. herbarium14]|uniref:DUF5895 domain-containing protein n=1 Tax=Microcoleus sp. herbarium14 TaxID=3055439 RepID=UPI002FCF29F9
MTKKPESVNQSVNESVNESVATEFQFDPALMGEEFNAPRIPRLPYGIVMNDNPAGLFIPEKNVIKAGWLSLTEEMFTEKELAGGEIAKGLFLSSIRMIILGAVPPYIRYKTSDELGDMRGVIVGSYEEARHLIDKKTMEVCSEHLVLFVDSNNNLLHTRPIRIRFKNVALWSLRESLEDFYIAMELQFAKLTHTKASGKSDRWRALCVLEAQFKGIKEGEGGNRSYCCKVEQFTLPTPENFHTLFLGAVQKSAKIWETYDMNVGAFMPSNQPLLGSK